MAVVQNPITGRSSGKFAGAIFSKWKNKNVLRSNPIEVNNPNSVNQQMRRSMFSACVELGRTLRPVIETGFIAFKSVETWMNSFIKYNNGTFTVPATPPAFTIDPAALTISKGSLTPTVIATLTATDGSPNVVATYSATADAIDQNTSDTVYAFAVNDDTGAVGMSLGTATRGDGTVTIVMDGNSTAGDTIYCYLFFLSVDGETVSDNDTESTVAA